MSVTKSTVLNSNISTVNIDIKHEYQYGYGYGNSNVDFFDVFGLSGNTTGFFAGEGLLNSVPGLDGYNYGYGYEYSPVITGTTRCKLITVKIETPEETSQQFDLKITVQGDGYTNVYTGTTSGTDHSFQFMACTFDNEEDLDYLYDERLFNIINSSVYGDELILSDSLFEQTKGKINKKNKDSFFEVIVEVLNTISIFSPVKVVSTINDDFIQFSKKINVKSTVS